MVSQIDAAKDTTIAIMSTSALLLTLLLAFISHLTTPMMKLLIVVADVSLYMAIGFNALVLVTITWIPTQKSTRFKPRDLVVLIILQLAPFLLGLVAITIAVMQAVTP